MDEGERKEMETIDFFLKLNKQKIAFHPLKTGLNGAYELKWYKDFDILPHIVDTTNIKQ